MSRFRATLPVLLLATALLAIPVHAGTQTDPEITDPADDVTVDSPLPGLLATGSDGFPEADILSVWVGPENDTVFQISVETNAEGTDSTEIAVGFEVHPGPMSVFGSTANGTAYSATATGTDVSGIAGATAARNGTVLTFTIPFASVGVSGGDRLLNLTVTSSQTNSDSLGLGLDETGTDTTADGTTHSNYTFSRPPVQDAVSLTITGGNADDEDGTGAFTGANVLVSDGNATITYTVQVTNTGSDPDSVALTVAGTPDEGNAQVSPTSFFLDPQESGTATLTVTLVDAGPGDHTATVQATTGRGATARVEATATVPTPPAPPVTGGGDGGTDQGTEEREVKPAGLDFLTPAAEALGFDTAFDSYAELVLLALIVLIIILVVVLLFFLGRTRWVGLEVTPKKLGGAPGQTVEFHVAAWNRKREFRDTKLRMDTQNPVWPSGLLLSQSEGQTLEPLRDAGKEIHVPITARDTSGDHYEGTLRVQIPEDARPGDRRTLAVTLVPLDHDDRRRPSKGRTRRVKIKVLDLPAVHHTEAAEASRDLRDPRMRLSEVRHDPADPYPGEMVTTRATVENDHPLNGLRVRAVLKVDGVQRQEKTFRVPPRSARAVLFQWEAMEGDHDVEVEVFDARS